MEMGHRAVAPGLSLRCCCLTRASACRTGRVPITKTALFFSSWRDAPSYGGRRPGTTSGHVSLKSVSH